MKLCVVLCIVCCVLCVVCCVLCVVCLRVFVCSYVFVYMSVKSVCVYVYAYLSVRICVVCIVCICTHSNIYVHTHPHPRLIYLSEEDSYGTAHNIYIYIIYICAMSSVHTWDEKNKALVQFSLVIANAVSAAINDAIWNNSTP